MVHNIVQSPASVVGQDKHAAVIVQWEGSGDHLPHKISCAKETQHSLVTRTVGYFTGITRVGAACGYLDDIQHRNVSQTTRCTVGWFGNILHPFNAIICHLRILILEQCSHAWKQVVLSYLSAGFYLGQWYVAQCCSMLAVWREVLPGTSELMSEATWGGPELRERQSPPLPFLFSMCLLFTCKTWASPPCSNHTLKTGTPCTLC